MTSHRPSQRPCRAAAAGNDAAARHAHLLLAELGTGHPALRAPAAVLRRVAPERGEVAPVVQQEQAVVGGGQPPRLRAGGAAVLDMVIVRTVQFNIILNESSVIIT